MSDTPASSPNPPADSDSPPSGPSTELRHSRWGIASVLTGLVPWIFLLLLLADVAAPHEPLPQSGSLMPDIVTRVSNGIVSFILAVTLMLAGGPFLLALGFGLAGLMQRDRKKVCAVLGCTLSAAGLVTVVGIAIVFV